MAEFKEVMKQFNRMCNSHKRCGTCPTCPINNDRELFTCYRWLTENAEKAEEIIMAWAKKNPFTTNRDKFKEVFGFDPIADRLDAVAWFKAEYKEPR